jgi:hypothetical protein
VAEETIVVANKAVPVDEKALFIAIDACFCG